MCAAAVTVLEDGLRPASLRVITSLKDKLPVEQRCLELLSPSSGCLSPDVKSLTFVPQFASHVESTQPTAECVGKYLLVDRVLPSSGSLETCTAIDTTSQQKLTCRILSLSKYQEVLAPYLQCGYHPHIANIVEIILGSKSAYVFFAESREDLHSYVRRKRRLRESEAVTLFRQIVSVVKYCHKRGIVLRDLKLRKFVFVDNERTHLILDGLEDAVLLDDEEDDRLTDKHGCPAYVSPEILTSRDYSGRQADMWSLGVILYTMLFGQYPFHDKVASQLFSKIRLGQYQLPDSVSTTARCLIRSLLRTDPQERLTVQQVARHPWFNRPSSHTPTSLLTMSRSMATSSAAGGLREVDQKVPEVIVDQSTCPLDLLDCL